MPINIFIVRLLSRLPACHKSCLILCPHRTYSPAAHYAGAEGAGVWQAGDSLCLCLFKKVASLPSFDLIKQRREPGKCQEAIALLFCMRVGYRKVGQDGGRVFEGVLRCQLRTDKNSLSFSPPLWGSSPAFMQVTYAASF